jgi:hypothetical protein
VPAAAHAGGPRRDARKALPPDPIDVPFRRRNPMNIRPRRLAVVAAATVALAGLGAPAALAADHTQALDIGAQLVRQPAGKPWIVNLQVGAVLGMSDGSSPSPVNHMVFSFTKGAKVHPEAFGTCTMAIIESKGPASCPKESRLGTGTANAHALEQDFPAKMQIFNGAKGKILIYAVALSTVQVYIEGTLKKTSGKFGYVLDLPIPRIRTVGDMDAAITEFHATVGGIGKKGVPFIEAPTACTGGGWPFAGKFTYADGGSGSAAASISCLLKATNS